MATDITNEMIPNDDVNAPDINFSNDTSNTQENPPELDYKEPSEGAKELNAIDEEIRQVLYPEPAIDEFVIGRDYDTGKIGISSKDLGIVVGHVTLPIAPSMSDITQNVSGMYGSRYLGTNFGSKVFNIPATIIADDADEFQKKVESLSNALIQVSKVEVPIRFGQFPERTYYGHFSALPEPQYIGTGSWYASLTLQFTASDPHGYLQSVVGDADNQNTMSIVPSGNDVTHPVYQFTFNKDSNNFGYTNSRGENVFVGFPDDGEIKDLMPIVYTDPMEDPATFTKVTNTDTIPWALANADVTPDGVVAPYSGWAIKNQAYWTAPKDYTGASTAFGNLLLGNKFTLGGTKDWEVSTRMAHNKYYSRAMGRVEAYLIGKDGHKIGRFGIQDWGGGGLTYVYIKFGKTIEEEEINLKNGFGYWGTGNTAFAQALVNQKPGFDITLTSNIDQPTLTIDRQVSLDFTQNLYDGHDSRYLPNAVKWVHYTRTVEKWKTPRDSSGKAIGAQVYSKEVEIDRVTAETVPNSPNIWNKSTQDYYRWTQVWNSAQGESLVWEKWHNTGTPRPGYGNGWEWRTTDRQKGNNWDKGKNRVNQPGYVTSQSVEHDYNDTSALTKFWGNFQVKKIGDELEIKVYQIGDNGLQTDNLVLDTSFNIPSGFDSEIAQIAYFFGKTPIHEDKITKTIPAKDDKPASYEFVKPYTDNFLFISTLWIKAITTADAIRKKHTIIHAGDSATIDTATENVYINGALANRYISPASTYPLLKGGVQDNIRFFPTADKAKVKYTYRPAMK